MWNKGPSSITILKSVFMSILMNVALYFFAKHHITVHCFCSNIGHFFIFELEESVAFRSASGFTSTYSKFSYLPELLEKTFKLFLSKTLWQMPNINNPRFGFLSHPEFVKSFRHFWLLLNLL
jgi:AAA+ ATPase superfamily predicted ATPase